MKGALLHPAEFRAIYAQGQKRIGRSVVVFALRNEEDPGRPLLGTVSSKKVGNAVRRNRARRVLRAAFAPLRDRLPPGTRIVLVARAACADPSARSPEIQLEIERILSDLELL